MEIGKKECEYCHESIDAKSRRCPFCGSLLNLSKNNEIQDYPDNQNFQERQNFQENQDYINSQDYSNQDYSIQDRDEAQDLPDNRDFLYTAQTNYNINNPNNNYTGNRNNYTVNKNSYARNNNNAGNTLSNAMKVFITVLASVVPGLGQIMGIIIAIIFMNSEDDVDKRSFGVALLVSSLILFVIACLSCFILTLFAGEVFENIPNNFNY